MAKIIRLTESDLERIIRRVIMEDKPSSFCKDINSPESQEMIENEATQIFNEAKSFFNELGISKSEIDQSGNGGEEFKKELIQVSRPVVENLDKDGLKQLMKYVKQLIRKNKTVEEQDLASLLKPIADIFAKIPPKLLIIVGVWYLLRCFRCMVYRFEVRLFSCGLKWKTSVLGRLTQLLFLDFRNLRDDDASEMLCFGYSF